MSKTKSTTVGLEKAILRLEKSEKVKDRVKKALELGASPIEIISSVRKGLEGVGERYEKREYFLMELIVAGNLASEVMSVLKPYIVHGKKVEGKILIGTVQGDFHDIGKSLVASMTSSIGLDVIDLGVDVSAQKFVDMVRKENPNILALSTLLSIGIPEMKRVIDAIKEAGLRDRVKIIVGGRPITREYALEIGADGYGEDAIEAIKIINQWLSEKERKPE